MVDIFTSNSYELEYELYQEYSRFNVYKVYKKYKKDSKRVFLYKITKERNDFGKKLKPKKDLISDLNKLMGVK